MDEARTDAKSIRDALTAAQQRLANLTHSVDSDEFATALAEMYDAFQKDDDTPEQRAAINRLLQQAGLKVTLHREQRSVGIAIGDGEPEWSEFEAPMARIVMHMDGHSMKADGSFEQAGEIYFDDDGEPFRLRDVLPETEKSAKIMIPSTNAVESQQLSKSPGSSREIESNRATTEYRPVINTQNGNPLPLFNVKPFIRRNHHDIHRRQLHRQCSGC